jgi:hypothetical protein
MAREHKVLSTKRQPLQHRCKSWCVLLSCAFASTQVRAHDLTTEQRLLGEGKGGVLAKDL